MKVLLDTHCWLWSVREPAKLNRLSRETIDAPETELFLSVASIWEITIKYQIGKLPLPKPPEDYVTEFTQLQGVATLAILPSHVYRTRHLPLLHRDPFDRLLIAQAITEHIPILTADPLIRQNKQRVIWAARRSAKSPSE